MTTLSDKEFDEKITVREAYLVIYEIYERHWQKDNSVELGDVLSVMSLWDTENGKAPIDSSVLPSFLESIAQVRKEMKEGTAIARAEIEFEK